MRTENTKETFSRELPTVSPAEIARFIKEGERRRAEAQAELLRLAGRGIARLARAMVTLLATPRLTQGGLKKA